MPPEVGATTDGVRTSILGLLLVSACAPPLSGFQPAHVPPAGHVQAEAGIDVSAPTGTISRTIDVGRGLVNAARQRALSDEERRRLIEAGASLALDPPSVVTHVAAAYAPLPGWELGLRYASGSLRLGGRTQLQSQDLATGHGFDLSVGLGISRQTVSFPVDSVLDYLTIDEFTRFTVDLPVLVGRRAPWYRTWGGARLSLSQYSGAMRLSLPATAGTPAELVAASVHGTGALVAMQGGAALGYQHLFLGFELTVARQFSGARLAAGGVSQDVDLGGLIISPGLALMGEF
jgi:hypothetical protein